MSKVIGMQTALDLMKEAVDERGDRYVYIPKRLTGACRYVEEDKSPGCIVGAILEKVGVPLEVRQSLDFGQSTRFQDWEVQGKLSQAGYSVPRQVALVLGDAQMGQDSGIDWGTVYAQTMQEVADLAHGEELV